jgi:hypothetical protein
MQEVHAYIFCFLLLFRMRTYVTALGFLGYVEQGDRESKPKIKYLTSSNGGAMMRESAN